MPFSTSRNTVARPKPEGYPKELQTIGDHIRAWRMDNCLTQAQVATVLGVCEDTVIGWEMRDITPSIRQMPTVVKLLGYLPMRINTETLGGRITAFRYLHGLTPEEFGKLIPADSSTVLAWENCKHIPCSLKLTKLERILAG